MFSAPSSPMPTSSTSSDSSPISTPFRKAKALYACKAEHDSELSFTAGTVFDNDHLPHQNLNWSYCGGSQKVQTLTFRVPYRSIPVNIWPRLDHFGSMSLPPQLALI
ncbi:hypothetical protein MJT46_007220 [Ovis ammon polii x Ovis aries]|nr:hypothetical protein MJT46_007220 [Ovis ammon polii x Ovis aries]